MWAWLIQRAAAVLLLLVIAAHLVLRQVGPSRARRYISMATGTWHFTVGSCDAAVRRWSSSDGRWAKIPSRASGTRPRPAITRAPTSGSPSSSSATHRRSTSNPGSISPGGPETPGRICDLRLGSENALDVIERLRRVRPDLEILADLEAALADKPDARIDLINLAQKLLPAFLKAGHLLVGVQVDGAGVASGVTA